MNTTPHILDRNQTERFANLFRGRSDAWGALHGESVKSPVTGKNYHEHLSGKVSLGVYPLLKNGSCWFGAVDVDIEDKGLVTKLYEELWNLGLKDIFIERSKSKGYHLWVFFSEPVQAKYVRRVLTAATKTVNVRLEVFPKQDHLQENELGSYINLPYFFGSISIPDRRVVVDRQSFISVPLKEFLDTAEQSLVTPSILEAILEELPPEPELPREKVERPKELPRIDLNALKMSEKIKKLIHGDFTIGQHNLIEVHVSGERITYPSRSEADEAIISSLLGNGYGDDVVFSVFEQFPTTGKYKETRGDRYLIKSIESAKRFVREREAQTAPRPSSQSAPKNQKPAYSDTIPVPATVLRDGRIVEMLYHQKERETSYAVFKDGELSYEKTIPLKNGITLIPYTPRNNLVKNGVVLFPSKAEEYGTEKELLEEIRNFIHTYVDLPPLVEKISCYYVLFSWIFQDFYELPYLRIIGDPGSGKTRFLRTVGSICYRPIFAGATSASAAFRLLDIFRSTLVIDEGDFSATDERAEITKILNNGNARGFPVVKTETIHAKGKEFAPRSFDVFSPKLIGSRRYFSDVALESRCLTIQTDQRKLRSDIPLNLTDEHEEQALRLRNKLLMFRFRNLGKRKLDASLVDRSIEPRLNQIFIPLLSVIEDEQAKEEIRSIAREYNRQFVAERGMTTEAEVLGVIQTLVEIHSEPSIKEIAHSFAAKYGEGFERRVTPKWIGGIVRTRLLLKTEKRENGFVIPASEKKKLEWLYEKYGLLDKKESPKEKPQVEEPFIY